MTDNTQINTGTGDTIRDIDRGSGIKTQIVQIDAGGALAESLVSTGNPLPTNLMKIGGSTLVLGQAVMATSLPVAIASNQSNIPVSIAAQTLGTVTIGGTVTSQVSGTVTVNQGASTWIVNLAQVGGSALAFGQAIMATSIPVAIASNQSNIPVSIAAQTLGTVTVGGTVTAVVSGTTVVSGTVTAVVSGTVTVSNATVNVAQFGGVGVALGQTTMVNSLPVVVASNQSNLPITIAAQTLGTVTIGGTVTAVVSGTVTAVVSGTTFISGGNVTAVVSGTTVISNTVSVADSLGNSQFNFPAGFVRNTDEPHQLFYDPFDSTNALDTQVRWTSGAANGGILASTNAGVMTMGCGTTANGYSFLQSVPGFTLPIPAWLGGSVALSLPDGAAPTANAYRFWGFGTLPTTPTAASPLINAVGFEVTTAGTTVCVVYSAGVRTVVATPATQITDANQHRFIVYVRTDKSYWYVDGLSSNNLVASSNFQAPQQQTLPYLYLAVASSTPPSTNTQIQSNGIAVWDTGKNSHQISDATYPWRKVAVSSSGALSVNPLLPSNAAQETTGQLQRIADLMEAMLLELRTQTLVIASLNQATPEDPTQLRNDAMNLLLN